MFEIPFVLSLAKGVGVHQQGNTLHTVPVDRKPIAAVGPSLVPLTLTVLDLTARVGPEALRHLPEAKEGDGPWRQLRIAGLQALMAVDWLRPSEAGELPPIDPDTVALFVLAGPGSLHHFAAVAEAARALALSDLCFLILPSAVMEGIHFKQKKPLTPPASDRRQPERVLRLPASDPQVIWMFLLEEVTATLLRHPRARELLSSQLESDMPSNLNETLKAAMSIEGTMAVSLVDFRSGMQLGCLGSGLNLELAAAGNSEVVRAKLRTAESLGIRGSIEDILITLSDQYHLIRLVPNNPGLFLYLVIDKQRGNLALARYKLADIERGLKL